MSVADHAASAEREHAEDRRQHADEANPPTDGGAGSGPAGTTFETLAVVGLIFGMFAIAASVFAVGLAARAVSEANGSSGGAAPSAAAGADAGIALEVSMGEFFIDPANASVAAGAALEVVNDGAIVHNLAVDGVATEMLGGGASATLDLSGLDAGTYTMICEVPGHEAAGMKGTLVIE